MTRAEPWGRSVAWIVALLLTALAIALRARQFGNPVIQIDDQFYLLTGDRWIHEGILPYVGIWDRKPIGLFAVFTLIRLLPGDGILAYQLVATACAAITAILIARIAARFSPTPGAIACGLIYLLWLNMLGGDGGQSPVFFNCLTVAAALLVLRLIERDARGDALRWTGAGAMALLGLAMQIKYTVLFEGVFFGVVLLQRSWRHDPPARMIANAAIWMTIALLPTAAAWAIYWAQGAGDAFVQANFLSIFGRTEPSPGHVSKRLIKMAALLAPVLIVPAAGLVRPLRAGDVRARFVAGWLAVACAGVLLFGSYYDHYALPILVPAAAALAPALAGRWARAIAVLLVVVGLVAGWRIVSKDRSARGHGAQVTRLAQRIGWRPQGCLYVFDGDPILYHLTDACMLSRFVFPSHLNHNKERDALGVPVARELQALFQRQPRFVVTTRPRARDHSVEATAFVDRELARSYRLVAAERVGKGVELLFERRIETAEAR